MIPEICLIDLLQEEKNAVWDYNNALSKIDFQKNQLLKGKNIIKNIKKNFLKCITKSLQRKMKKLHK